MFKSWWCLWWNAKSHVCKVLELLLIIEVLASSSGAENREEKDIVGDNTEACEGSQVVRWTGGTHL